MGSGAGAAGATGRPEKPPVGPAGARARAHVKALALLTARIPENRSSSATEARVKGHDRTITVSQTSVKPRTLPQKSVGRGAWQMCRADAPGGAGGEAPPDKFSAKEVLTGLRV